MVSVIIPCYNSFQWMERCIAALERQSYRSFEVIVVDDASTDGSYESLNELTVSFPLQVIRLEENRGPGHARNVGIEAAKGDWIAFCDADDWYADDFIEKMIEATERDGADLVICDNSHDYADGKTEALHKLDVFSGDPSKEELLALQEPSLCRLLVKRELFSGVRLPEVYHAEDVATAPVLMSRASRVALVREPLYHYFLREGSASRAPSVDSYKDFLSAFLIVEKELALAYPVACEYRGVDIVLYGATLNAVKAGVESSSIVEVIDEFTNRYPQWKRNKYVGKLGIRKRIYLAFVDNRMILPLRFYALLHRWAQRF